MNEKIKRNKRLIKFISTTSFIILATVLILALTIVPTRAMTLTLTEVQAKLENGEDVIIGAGDTLLIEVDQTLWIPPGRVLTNNGEITNDFGKIVNDGKFINNNWVNNRGFINNQGTIVNDVSASSFENYGDVNNSGLIVNNSWFYTKQALSNNGVIENNGLLENRGIMDIKKDCVFNNNGDFFNSWMYNVGIINNKGAIDNPGIFYNEGVINNYGKFENSYMLNIVENGKINNYGELTNTHSFNNGGEINNYGGVITKNAFNGNPIIEYYLVTFVDDTGSGAKPQWVKSGNLALKPDNPTNGLLEFKGWSLGGNLYNFNTPVTGNITLVAVWEGTIPPPPPPPPGHGHEFINDTGVIISQPTCEKMGVCEAKCSVLGCNEVGTRFFGSPLGHEFINDTGVIISQPTCEKMGVCEAKCSRLGCNAVGTRFFGSPLGQEFINDTGVVIKAPTATEPGILEAKCSRLGCDAVGTRTIPALGVKKSVPYTICGKTIIITNINMIRAFGTFNINAQKNMTVHYNYTPLKASKDFSTNALGLFIDYKGKGIYCITYNGVNIEIII